MYVAIILLSLLSSIQAQGFTRCLNDTIEVAWRQYAHPDYDAQIDLLGLTHWAPSSFYDDIQNYIKSKHVIYEGTGDSLEERKNVYQRLETLSPNYKHLFLVLNSWQGMKNSLGQVQQPQFDYSQCSSAIHADIDLIDTPGGKSFYGDDNHAFEANLRKLAAAYIGEKNNIIEINNHILDMIFQKKSSLLVTASPKQHFECQRKNIINNSEQMCPLRSKVIKFGIINNINELLKSSDKNKDIVVIFGASHLPRIEEELLRLGFRVTNETWHQVAAISNPI